MISRLHSCVDLTGGVEVHIMGLEGREAEVEEEVLRLAQEDRVHPLVQNYRQASEDLDTPSHRPSYHSSCHPQSALLYEYTMLHHTHLEGELISEL